jgi:hypothetical protein
MDQKSKQSQDASRVLFWLFVAASCGLIATTIASTLGPEAIRTLMLTVLIATFVAGGGILGMIAMQHLARTHLPDEKNDLDAPLALFSDPEKSLRGKGFLGMFPHSEDSHDAEVKQIHRTA